VVPVFVQIRVAVRGVVEAGINCSLRTRSESVVKNASFLE
jgi:hypothetical protein